MTRSHLFLGVYSRMHRSTRWFQAHKDEPEVMEAKRAASRRFYARNAEVLRARRLLRYYEAKTAAIEYALEANRNGASSVVDTHAGVPSQGLPATSSASSSSTGASATGVGSDSDSSGP
jgi:hypothetical protein